MMAVDRRDPDAAVACFTSDAVIHFPGVDARGEHEIYALFSGRTPTETSVPELAGFRRTLMTHSMTTMLSEVDGDEAVTRTYATAHLCGMFGDRETIVVRGLRYLDRAVRTSGGWRIRERHHVVDWMYEVPPMSIAQHRAEL